MKFFDWFKQKIQRGMSTSSLTIFVIFVVGAIALTALGLGIYASTKSTSISSGGGTLGSPAGDIVYTNKVQTISNKTFPNITTKHFSTAVSSAAPTIQSAVNCAATLVAGSTDTSGAIQIVSPSGTNDFTIIVRFGTSFTNTPLAVLVSPAPGINLSTFSLVTGNPGSQNTFVIQGHTTGAATQDFFYLVVGNQD